MAWTISKDTSGRVEYTCKICGQVYDMTSAWDVANLDWHEHETKGV